MKISYLKTISISLGLLSTQVLFAQHDYSNSSGYVGKKDASSCQLMMNPVLEEAEKAIEKLIIGERPVTVVNNLGTATREQVSVFSLSPLAIITNVTSSVQEDTRISQQLEKAIDVEMDGKSEVAQALRDIAKQNQLSIEYFIKGERAQGVGNWEQGNYWKNASVSYKYVVEKLEKASEAEINGRSECAQLWREAARQDQLSGEFYSKAVGYITEKIKGEFELNAIADGYRNIAAKLGKAIEADLMEKPEIAQAWRDLVRHYQLSIESYTKCTTEYIAGKRKEGENWRNAGYYYAKAADQLANAIEAEARGKPKNIGIALTWGDEIRHYQLSSDSYTKAAIAHATGKTNGGRSFDDEGEAANIRAKALAKQVETLISNSEARKKAKEEVGMRKRIEGKEVEKI